MLTWLVTCSQFFRTHFNWMDIFQSVVLSTFLKKTKPRSLISLSIERHGAPLFAQIVDALLMNLPYTVYYLFGTYEREFLLKELYKFLLSFCNCYPSFPDCLFGVSQIHQPIIKLLKKSVISL